MKSLSIVFRLVRYSLIFVGMFLLIGSVTYIIRQTPKEVKAVAGQLNIVNPQAPSRVTCTIASISWTNGQTSLSGSNLTASACPVKIGDRVTYGTDTRTVTGVTNTTISLSSAIAAITGSGSITVLPSLMTLTDSGGTFRMVVDDSGNVGIGTMGPGYKLDIQGGDINVANNLREGGAALSGKYAYVGGGNASGTWGINVTGNAATVGGVGFGIGSGVASLVYGANGYRTTNISGTLSPQQGSGFYDCSSCTDAPVAGTWTAYMVTNHYNSVAGNGYQLILAQPFWADTLYVRRVNADTKNAWRAVLDSGNYNSYAPTLTGTGASGTWGINVTGNAATVTNGLYTTSTIANAINNGTLYAPTTGNVGIGTTGPNAALEVSKASADGTTLQEVARFSTTGRTALIPPGVANRGALISFSDANNFTLTSAIGGIRPNSSGDYNGALAFYTNNTGASNATAVTQLTEQMRITNTGNVGIGTTSPAAKLDVQGATSVLSNPSGNLTITPASNLIVSNGEVIATSLGSGQFRMVYGNYGVFLRQDGTNTYFLVTNSGDQYGSWNTLRPLYFSNSSGYVTFGNGHNDLAENYFVSGQALKASLVSIDETTSSTLTPAGLNHPNIIGVITTNPGAVMDAKGGFHIGYKSKDVYNNEKAPIALVGTVPTLVTSLNGTITMGDPITVSTMPGFGAKATSAGMIVGKAIEAFYPSDSSCPTVPSLDAIKWPSDDGLNPNKPCFKLPDGTYVGKIVISLNASWYDPDITLTSTGDIKITSDSSGHYMVEKQNGSLINRISSFAQLVVGQIQSGLIEAKKIVVDGVDVGKKLIELEQKVNDQEKQINELKIQIKQLQNR